MPALISICLPNLNTRPFLEERMETILAQTVTDWELIICDSYSDDGSWEFFQKFKGDRRIRMYQVPREGLYAGWNECLRRARGEYVYVATSDDTMEPCCLEKLMAPLEICRHIDIAVCDFQKIDEHGRAITWRPHYHSSALAPWLEVPSVRSGKMDFLLHAALGGTMWVTMASVMIRRCLLDRIGLFRVDLGSYADIEWTLRACLTTDVSWVPGRLATFRIHADQASSCYHTPGEVRALLDAITELLDDPSAGIPEAWKGIPGWKDVLLKMYRIDYEDSFYLYRWAARSHPWRFLRGVCEAVRREPLLLATRALHGFRWQEDRHRDPWLQARHLIELFHPPWPPKALSIPSAAGTSSSVRKISL